MKPSLGVLITYYNEGSYLTECLDTLLSGPDRPDEILIYDDASQDPATNYIKDHHQPVRVIRGEKNIGIGLARNELMHLSQSDYIHFQDADDYFDSEWCRLIREILVMGQVDIVFNNVAGVDRRRGVLWNKRRFPFDRLESNGDLIHFFLGVGHYVLVSMVTFRRELGLKIGGYLPRDIIDVSEDFEFHMRLFALRLRHRTIDKVLVIKGNRPGSLTYDEAMKTRPEIRISRLKVSRLLLKWLPEDYHSSMAKYLLRSALPHLENKELREAIECYELAKTLKVPDRIEEIADSYHLIASEFLKIGDTQRAKEAFQYSRLFCQAEYKNYPRSYRLVAKIFGGESAERFTQRLRQTIPEAGCRLIKKIIP